MKPKIKIAKPSAKAWWEENREAALKYVDRAKLLMRSIYDYSKNQSQSEEIEKNLLSLRKDMEGILSPKDSVRPPCKMERTFGHVYSVVALDAFERFYRLREKHIIGDVEGAKEMMKYTSANLGFVAVAGAYLEMDGEGQCPLDSLDDRYPSDRYTGS